MEPREPNLNIVKQPREEQQRIVDAVKQGEIYVAKFHGQTYIHIPNALVSLIGVEKIRELVRDFYPGVAPHKLTDFQYENSLMLDVPAQVYKPDGTSTDDRVERLVVALESFKNKNKPSPIYKEHGYVMDDLIQGKFHIAKFGGQTHVYIPKPLFELIGKDKVLEIAKEIYTSEVLEEFHYLFLDYENSFMLELPPQEFSKVSPGRDPSDDRVERFVKALESYKK